MRVVKVPAVFLIFALTIPCIAEAAGCPSLTKQLARLRLEYYHYVNGPDLKPDGSGFDELAEILDKIVDVIADMRKSNCKISPRPKSFDKESDTGPRSKK
jgi:hypothetical protein